jgi:adenine phosphoribosyltransferase
VVTQAVDLLSKIRTIPDFPRPGIMFRDITTLLKDAAAFRHAVDLVCEHYRNDHIDKVVSVESRGFILGSVLAYKLHAGFIPIRKPGKLPAATIRQPYVLEYGEDAVEIHQDAVSAGERVLVHDDLLATGGTALAACQLVERRGGVVAGVSFLIELNFLNGREKLKKYPVFSLMEYRSE